MLCLPLLVGMTSCNKDDEPKNNENGTTALTQSDIEKGIIGKWKRVAVNGQECLTNQEDVHTFRSDGTVQWSCAYSSRYAFSMWNKMELFNYGVNGTTITEEGEEEGLKLKYTMNVSELTPSRLILKDVMLKSNDNPLLSYQSQEYKRMDVDYSQDIVGLWEGVEMTGDTTFGDINHRWEYKADGSYLYYVLENGVWVPSTNTYNEYFVDGDYFACRWKDSNNIEYREWWDIKIEGDVMTWTALRDKGELSGGALNGQRFRNTFKLQRIKPL